MIPDRDSLYRIAFAACGDHHLSEEAVADLTVKIQDRTMGNDPRPLSPAWFKTVMTNFIRDEHRRSRRAERAPATTLEIVLDPADDPSERAEREEMLGAVAAEFGSLPDSLREILELRFLEGMSMKAASAQLEVPVGTLEKRARRAMDTLRERFERKQLAGGVTVAAAIRRSGHLQPAVAAATGAVVVARAVASLAALLLAVGGVAWLIQNVAGAGPQLDDLEPLSRVEAAGAGSDDDLAGVDDASRSGRAADDASSDQVESPSVSNAGPAAPEAVTPPPAEAGVTYPVTVRITIDGKPVQGWIGMPARYEIYAQSVNIPPQITIDETPRSNENGEFTYTLPLEPRGSWDLRFSEERDLMDPSDCYVHVNLDPQSQLKGEPGGPRRLEIDLQTTSKTFEGGKKRFTPNERVGVQMVHEVQPGVWAIGGQGLEDTGDDMVFPTVFVGFNRLCRLPRYDERTDPGGYPPVEPAWEGHIEPR